MNIPFPEVFLHYVWKLKLFDYKKLKTSQGENLELIHVGFHNHNSGPDFSNARVRVGETLWAGSVEIHKKSSDWFVHKHSEDAAYNNTILHVVYQHDLEVYRSNGEIIPTLELKQRIPPKYIKRYRVLINNQNWVPCANQLPELLLNSSQSQMSHWIDKLLFQRLDRKTKEIKLMLQKTQYNWEETFYYFLAKSFGIKNNAVPFGAVATSLSLIILGRHKQNLFQIESLLFGQAGFLEETFFEKYPLKLQQEYLYFKKKYNLTPLNKSFWKFGKLRPSNFPTIRLAQFALLIHKSNHLFSKILNERNISNLKSMFQIKLSGFWETHYLFGELSPKRNKRLGAERVDLLLINTIVPFLYAYGLHKGQEVYKERAVRLLKSLKAENNAVVNSWKSLRLEATSAYDSQALIQLKKKYCDDKRCLDCLFGKNVLQTHY